MHLYEPRHDKTNKVTVRPAKTQISLGIRSVWSESSLSAWRKLGSFATHWAHSEDSDQTGRMPRLIRVFAGHTVTLLVLSCCGSYTVTAFNPILNQQAESECSGLDILDLSNVSHVMRNFSAEMCDDIRLKQTSPATKANRSLGIWIKNLSIILSRPRLCRCAGWAAPFVIYIWT